MKVLLEVDDNTWKIINLTYDMLHGKESNEQDSSDKPTFEQFITSLIKAGFMIYAKYMKLSITNKEVLPEDILNKLFY